MLTAETLTRHELAGLRVRVVESSDPTLVGVEGEVVDETTKTLSVAREGETGSRLVQVPKAVATFEFELPSEDGDTEYVVVEGERLVARPARRTEHTGDSRWQ
ncbi:ribonuclease P protein component 1 [Halomarina litorea]|uniref:ribonuclease P protein component 1 n=1 Tax=Halomarina litorea TaxID=2961595 RepID=UPI0020C41F6D|nr:ribonuclease P protein component 1 [Halomarina sp. BCD28]